MVSLTTADQTRSVRLMRGRLSEFERRLRVKFPQVAYVVVMERHKSGALHAHVGLSEFVHYTDLRKMWTAGILDVRKIRAKRGGREDSRITARYLSKYVVKDPVRDGLGGHRYEVRQGFQPSSRVVWGETLMDAERSAIALMGGEVPSFAWSSSGTADWNGPPSSFLSWG